MSIEEMENRLKEKGKRPENACKSVGGKVQPHTARALLAENQLLSQEKQKNFQMERKASRELIDELFERDRQSLERDRTKQKKRREAHHALAQKYKAAIVQKELTKAKNYEEKINATVDEFFPFNEGETVEKYREEQNNVLKDEMRNFLKTQREEQPVRADPLIKAVKPHHHHHYPITGAGILPNSRPKSVDSQVPGGVIAPHICGKHPLFLSRAREHMSRRIADEHVRKAMEEKVELMKTQLETLAADRHSEARRHEEGLMINDALRYDNALIKATERQKNAEFLRGQIEERKKRADAERKEQRATCAGYWGPEEKDLQAGDLHDNHCRHLIAQMEVNQHRRLDSRHRRLQQEKKLIENSMREMAVDRLRDREKADRHRAVLTHTWANQQKIRSAVQHVEGIGS